MLSIVAQVGVRAVGLRRGGALFVLLHFVAKLYGGQPQLWSLGYVVICFLDLIVLPNSGWYYVLGFQRTTFIVLRYILYLKC